jgi:hypothetical protein
MKYMLSIASLVLRASHVEEVPRPPIRGWGFWLREPTMVDFGVAFDKQKSIGFEWKSSFPAAKEKEFALSVATADESKKQQVKIDPENGIRTFAFPLVWVQDETKRDRQKVSQAAMIRANGGNQYVMGSEQGKSCKPPGTSESVPQTSWSGSPWSRDKQSNRKLNQGYKDYACLDQSTEGPLPVAGGGLAA